MCYINTESNAKLRLEKSIKDNYKYITETLVNVKGAFISICADIDRYIRLKTRCEIREDIDEEAVKKLEDIYPYLSGLKIDQWRKVICIFIAIRNDNAHLYQNKPVYIDRDILIYLKTLNEPRMAVVANGNELTLYGAYYFLSFLAQKFQIWTFTSLLLRRANFVELEKVEVGKFQTSHQHSLQKTCGIGKPIGQNSEKATVEVMYLNDTLRRKLTNIFLKLEAVAFDKNKAVAIAPKFREILSSIEPILKNQELFDRMIFLRNAWFHGHSLGDEVVLPNGEKKIFDLTDTMETMYLLKETLIWYEKYDPITEQVDSFGKALLDFKVLRLVELSYKVLDSRLLKKDKFDSRLEQLLRGFENFNSIGDEYYRKASALLFDGPLSWKLSWEKFSDADYRQRETCVEELKIIVLRSDSGFDIGGNHTDLKTLVFCDVTLPLFYSLKINGHRISEFPLTLERDVCSRVKVYSAHA